MLHRKRLTYSVHMLCVNSLCLFDRSVLGQSSMTRATQFLQ